MDLESLRREYRVAGLTRDMLAEDPIIQFEQWMQQIIAGGITDPTAMTLATVDAQGQPSQRIVLLKHFDDRGFVFYTNYSSRKAADMASNSKVSLHFPWHCIERQVKVLGCVTKVSYQESLSYFLSRPRDSQIAAWASQQSAQINSRTFLLAQFESLKQKFVRGEVPLPDFWGGYRVEPRVVEFWQGRENRLHDRFEYRLTEDGKWQVERLAP